MGGHFKGRGSMCRAPHVVQRQSATAERYDLCVQNKCVYMFGADRLHWFGCAAISIFMMAHKGAQLPTRWM